MSKARMIGVSLLAMALAAPVLAGTVTRDDQHPFYGPGLVNYVASRGPVPAVVINNPFGGDAGNAALVSELQLPGFFTQSSLVPVKPAERNDGHLVFVFDPAKTYPGGRAVCQAPEKFSEARKDGTLRLQAAFCYNNDIVSEAYLETPRPRDQSDPGFRQSMAQLMNSLLPSQVSDGEQCPTAPNC